MQQRPYRPGANAPRITPLDVASRATAEAVARRLRRSFAIECDVTSSGATYAVTPRFAPAERHLAAVKIVLTGPTVDACERLLSDYLAREARLVLGALLLDDAEAEGSTDDD